MASNWMKKGVMTSDEIKNKPAYTNSAPNFPREFWLTKGDSARVIILDDSPQVFYYRHFGYIPNNKQSGSAVVACLDGASESPSPKRCPICNAALQDQRIKRKLVSHITVLNATGYTDKRSGKQRRFIKTLVALDQEKAQLLMGVFEDRGTLRGIEFKVERTQKDKSPSLGDVWYPMDKKVDLKKLSQSPEFKEYFQLRTQSNKTGKKLEPKDVFKEWLSPYNYEEKCEPTEDKVRYFLNLYGHDPDEYLAGSSSDSEDYSDIDKLVNDESGDFDSDFNFYEDAEEEVEKEKAASSDSSTESEED